MRKRLFSVVLVMFCLVAVFIGPVALSQTEVVAQVNNIRWSAEIASGRLPLNMK